MSRSSVHTRSPSALLFGADFDLGAERSFQHKLNSRDVPSEDRVDKVKRSYDESYTAQRAAFVMSLFAFSLFLAFGIYTHNFAFVLFFLGIVSTMIILPTLTKAGVVSVSWGAFWYPIFIWFEWFFLVVLTGGFSSPFVGLVALNIVNWGNYITVAPFSNVSTKPLTRIVWTSIFSLLLLEQLDLLRLLPQYSIPDQYRRSVTIVATLHFLYQGFFRMTMFTEVYLKALAIERQSNDDRAAFVANISHEFRTPLTSILGWTDILLSGPTLNDEQRQQLEIVKISGKTLLTLIGDILDYSKIEKGKLELEEAVFDLDKVVNQALSSTAVLVKRGVQFRAHVDLQVGGHALCLGDSHRLVQVINNFISNAAKFTNSGQIEFSAKVKGIEPVTLRSPLAVSERKALVADGAALVTYEFKCRDSGIGISARALSQLFRPFKQAESSTTRRFGGSGLGLAIARVLVHAMGGSVEIRSTEGQGTEVVWTFALRSARRPSQSSLAAGLDLGLGLTLSPTSSSDMTVAESYSQARPLRVLLADDNEFNQKIISKILTTLHCQVLLASNGQEAVNVFASHATDIDLVLMDVQMPVMDGLEATRLIRDMGEVPIHGLTANADSKSLEDCAKAGMLSVLAKPINYAALRLVLDDTRSSLDTKSSPS